MKDIIQKVKRMKIKNKEKGITLIALVVTIVVLLILAGVSVNALFGNSGIIEKAKEAQNKMDEAKNNDLAEINKLTNFIDNAVNGTTGGSSTGGVTEETPKPGSGHVINAPDLQVTASCICNIQVVAANGTKVTAQNGEINIITLSEVDNASDEIGNSLTEALDSISIGELEDAITNKKIDYIVTELTYIDFSGTAKSAVEQAGAHYELDYINNNISLGKIVYFTTYKDGTWTETVKGTCNNNAVHVTLNDIAPIAVLVVD